MIEETDPRLVFVPLEKLTTPVNRLVCLVNLRLTVGEAKDLIDALEARDR